MTVSLDDDIIRHGLLIAAEEAAITVVRAAHSQFIVEGSDAGTAILTREGELVAQAAATSMLHSGGMVESLRAVREDFAIEEMVDGDVFIVNDTYRGGVHANDVMLCRPVVIDGTVELFTATLIHVLDLGGGAHGGINTQAQETLEEGLQLPPLHYAHGGVRNDELVKLIRLNSRSGVETIGDIDALAAGALVCARRLETMFEHHGGIRLHEVIRRYLDETEAQTGAAIAALTEGCYRGAAVIDDDGTADGLSFDIKVEVTIEGGTMSLDFAGSSPQVRAAVNSSASQAFDSAVFAVRCFLDKSIASNAGLYRPIRAHFPRGSMLNPDPPHPCGGRMMASYAIVDAVVEALSQAVPDGRMARSGIIAGFAIAGVSGEYWIHNSFDMGGVGARWGQDGPHATGFHFGVGRSQIPQVEPIESRCRLRVESLELIEDSGGAGRWRGGLGARTVFRLLEDAVISMRTDHFTTPPTGVVGGATARAGALYILDQAGRRTDLPSKAANIVIKAGCAFVIETSGGGGVGPPKDRPAQWVARDVHNGIVSAEAAWSDYGWSVHDSVRKGDRQQ
jgi:N-methylhydantoinase B